MQLTSLAVLFMASVALAAPGTLYPRFSIISDCAGDKCRVNGQDYDCKAGTCYDGGHCGGPDVNSLTCEM